jgi:hypothetical protein
MVPIFFTLLAQDNYISVSDILNYTQSKPFSPAFGNTLLAAVYFHIVLSVISSVSVSKIKIPSWLSSSCPTKLPCFVHTELFPTL